MVARLIAYLFVGSFCLAGPVLLIIALATAAQRVALVYSGQHAEGTVIAKRQTASGRASYAPVFQFTANDGRTYVVSSDVYGRESDFRFGEHVAVLYRRGEPESARIDAFAPLWTFPLVFGVVGAGFSVIPAVVLRGWIRRRRGRDETGRPEAAQEMSDSVSPGVRLTLGLLLTAGGLVLFVLGVVASAAPSLNGSRVIVASVGVLLAASGVLLGQWVTAGSRLSDALGGAVVTSMAVIFGWVAIYGEASGFSGGVSIGGAAVTTGGSVTVARIAFGTGALLLGLASLWAWKRALRPRG